MLGLQLLACKWQISTHLALSFSPDLLYPAAKTALIEVKFTRFRLHHENPNTL